MASARGTNGSSLKTALWVLGGAAGAISVANALLFRLAPDPSHALGGSFDRYPAREGDVAYTVRGTGSPVLLLHGWGAGNSMVEWERNIAALAEHHTVYALDFLGWGLSDKPKKRHTAQEYVEMVGFFLEDVVREPCALVASNGACPVAIEVAAQVPALVSKLLLVCPPPGGEKGASDPARLGAEVLLRAPGVNTLAYNALASRASIEKFTSEHLFFDPSKAGAAWANRLYANAHAADAPHAVYSFLSGSLDLDARQSWSRLEQPALLVWGRHARLTPLDGAPEWLALKPDAGLQVIDDALLLPHVEHPDQWNRIALEFIGAARTPESEN